MANNLTPANFTDIVFPAARMGEDMEAGDLVGVRADTTDNVRKVFKAFGGVTAGGNVQLEALGVVLKKMYMGAYDGIWWVLRVNGVDAVTSGSLLEGLLHGEKVYLSTTVPGKAVRTKPTGAGKLLQVVGNGYYDKRRDPKAGDLAGGVLIRIRDAVTL